MDYTNVTQFFQEHTANTYAVQVMLLATEPYIKTIWAVFMPLTLAPCVNKVKPRKWQLLK